MPRYSTPDERFWSKVDTHGPTPEHCPEIGPCWIWTGSTRSNGYGQFSFRIAPRRSKTWGAHKTAFVLSGGELTPEHPWTLHHCDNPPCVRPSHLFAGSPSDNTRDAMRKGRYIAFTGMSQDISERTRRIADMVMSGRTVTQTAAYFGESTANVARMLEIVQRGEASPVLTSKVAACEK